jgi:murein hydrolase activator
MPQLVLIVLIVAACVPPLAAQAPDARVAARAARADERLRALHAEADRLAAEARTLLGDLRRLEVDRRIAAEELQRINDETRAAVDEIASLSEEVRQLEADNEAELPVLRQRLVEVYKLGAGRYTRLLLGTTELRRIGQATRTVALLARSDRERVETRRRRVDALRSARASIEERGARLAMLRTDAQRADAAAARAVRERTALVRDIDQRRDLTARLAGELQLVQEQLQRTIGASGAAGDATGLPLAPFRGDLGWPVAGAVRQRFGGAPGRPLAASASGIEIAAAEGTPVRAVHDGQVAFAGPFMGFGNLVLLQHDGTNVSLYGHLLDVDVTADDTVAAGDVIGSTGVSATGTAGLYFELRIDARPVDPLQWLEQR